MSSLSPEAFATENCVAKPDSETAQAHKYIADHLTSLEEWQKESWQDSVIGFMTLESGRHVCAFSASAPEAISVDAVNVVLATMERYNKTAFVPKIEVSQSFVQLAKDHGGHAGCAEKKLLAYAQAEKKTINGRSITAWRVQKAHVGITVKYISPCKSCAFCMFEQRHLFF